MVLAETLAAFGVEGALASAFELVLTIAGVYVLSRKGVEAVDKYKKRE